MSLHVGQQNYNWNTSTKCKHGQTHQHKLCDNWIAYHHVDNCECTKPSNSTINKDITVQYCVKHDCVIHNWKLIKILQRVHYPNFTDYMLSHLWSLWSCLHLLSKVDKLPYASSDTQCHKYHQINVEKCDIDCSVTAEINNDCVGTVSTQQIGAQCNPSDKNCDYNYHKDAANCTANFDSTREVTTAQANERSTADTWGKHYEQEEYARVLWSGCVCVHIYMIVCVVCLCVCVCVGVGVGVVYNVEGEGGE